MDNISFKNSSMLSDFVKANSGFLKKEGDALFAFFISDQDAFKVKLFMENKEVFTNVSRSTPNECADSIIEMNSMLREKND